VTKGKEITNFIGMRFVFIKPGSFMMGSPEKEAGRLNNEVQHKVTLTKGFFIQETEVTQGQWKKVMGNNPSIFKDCGDDCPVENVSWNDAKAFITKLNQMEGKAMYRLPTEAEWEYACRAGTSTLFAFGEYLYPEQVRFKYLRPLTEFETTLQKRGPVKVASYPPNAWGVYDMHGNVGEWCEDEWDDYPSSPVTDPLVQNTKNRNYIRRGGSWDDEYVPSIRSAQRCPLDRLLIETDAPYLAPTPYRGKQNEPSYVRHVAEEIARLRQLSLDEIASASTTNFKNLFRHAQLPVQP
jgi:formylglycine-generating enzyme required for sulfatase activity